jgi:hypothetical protein
MQGGVCGGGGVYIGGGSSWQTCVLNMFQLYLLWKYDQLLARYLMDMAEIWLLVTQQ